jgi:epoxyqueuosine reductase
MSVTDDVKAAAHKAGFHAVGITTAEPFYEAEKSLKEKWSQGILDGSSYGPESIHFCTHPQESLPGAHSIISVALSYLTENPPAPQDGLCGSMARFAWGLDYHKVMQERLSNLSARLQKIGRGKCRMLQSVDTRTFSDRAVAVRAGIGFQGKNTCFHARGWGSWVVLGAIATDLPLDPDPPAKTSLCGDCDRCMKACPAGAITAPGTVDMRLCLSQATQMKGFIPHALREKMGDRIYGCDDCQNACPLNTQARRGGIRELSPSSGLGATPKLLPLLSMTKDEFARKVEPTTAGWIGRIRIKRNAAVALGNSGDSSAVPALISSLKDPSSIVRGHSAWALAKLGGGEAADAVKSALADEADPEAASEMKNSLLHL